MQTVEVVVANYNENVEWTSGIRHKVTIYDKSQTHLRSAICLPNVGREANTFLYHIVFYYDHLADIIIFLQGNPFDHISELNGSVTKLIHAINTVSCAPGTFRGAWQPLLPHGQEQNEPLYEAYYRRARKIPFENYPSTWGFPFAAGGQYIVSKESIRGRPLEFWKKVLDMSITNINGDESPDKMDAWSLEVIWPLLFDPFRHPVLNWP